MEATKKLEHLLFGEGRELLDLRLTVPDKYKDAETLAEAVHDSLRFALDPSVPDSPPRSGRQKASLQELFGRP